MKNYNWATYGTGVIANQLAQALQKQNRTLYSVANRTHSKGVAFAEKYGIQKVCLYRRKCRHHLYFNSS